MTQERIKAFLPVMMFAKRMVLRLAIANLKVCKICLMSVFKIKPYDNNDII